MQVQFNPAIATNTSMQKSKNVNFEAIRVDAKAVEKIAKKPRHYRKSFAELKKEVKDVRFFDLVVDENMGMHVYHGDKPENYSRYADLLAVYRADAKKAEFARVNPNNALYITNDPFAGTPEFLKDLVHSRRIARHIYEQMRKKDDFGQIAHLMKVLDIRQTHKYKNLLSCLQNNKNNSQYRKMMSMDGNDKLEKVHNYYNYTENEMLGLDIDTSESMLGKALFRIKRFLGFI